MSGPKCGSYDAEAARRRREREEAVRLLADVVADVERFNRVERKQMAAAYGVKVGVLSEPAVGRREDVAALRGLANELRDQLQAARSELSERSHQVRRESLTGLFDDWKVQESAGSSPGGNRVATHAVLNESLWLGRVTRAIEGFPTEAIEAEYEQATSYAEQARAVLADPGGSPTEIRSLVTALDRVAHDAGKAATARAEAVAVAERLRARVNGFELDPEGDDLLTSIHKTIETDGVVALPAEVERRVAAYESRRGREVAEQDRLLVLAAAREALEEQGFDLGEEFQSTSMLDCLATSDDEAHALRFREVDGELRFNLVRVDRGGSEALSANHRREDTTAEEQWCDSFASMQQSLEAQGVTLDLTYWKPPGEHPIHKMTLGEIEAEFGYTTRDRVASAVSAGPAIEADDVVERDQQQRERRR